MAPRRGRWCWERVGRCADSFSPCLWQTVVNRSMLCRMLSGHLKSETFVWILIKVKVFVARNSGRGSSGTISNKIAGSEMCFMVAILK